MIGRIRGELIGIDGNLALIEAGGVGYEVSVPDALLARLGSPGDEVCVLIRQIFREDGVSLFGFLEPFQRRLFDLLLSVKGCGPKVGLALVGQLGEDVVAAAIVAQDARVLARATGVGARLAERIILELRDKMQEETLHRKLRGAVAPPPRVSTPADELVDALIALGYRRAEAETAAAASRESSDSVAEQLKLALNQLRR